MNSPDFRSSQNPFFVILLLAVTVFFGYMFGTLFLDLIFRSFLNNSVADIVFSKDSLGLLIVQGVTSIFAFIIAPGLFSIYWMKISFSDLFESRLNTRLILLTVVLLVIIVPFNSFLVEWNADIKMPDFLSAFEAQAKATELELEELVMSMLSFKSPLMLLLAIFVVGFVPAVGEEFLFRGLIQSAFLKSIRSPYLAIFLVAILFSAFHMQFYGFFPRLMLGLLLGLIYFWSGNLFYSILFHFLNNSLTVIFYYLYNIEVIGANIMDDHTLPYITVIFSFMVTFISLLYFRRITIVETNINE